MKIAVFYNRDMYALKALQRLLPALGSHDVVLFHSAHIGHANSTIPERLGALGRFERELFTRMNNPASAARSGSGLDALIARYAHSDTPLPNPNSGEGLHTLAAANPELILSIRYGRIFKDDAIGLAQHGVLNLHSGILPAYRGVMPTFRALAAGEPVIGTTLHWICDSTIDTGPAIALTEQVVRRDWSYLRHVWTIYDDGVGRILKAVEDVQRGRLTAPRDSHSWLTEDGQYFSYPDDAALDGFEAQGWRLFDPADMQALGL